mgnify:CR=1 FL=1
MAVMKYYWKRDVFSGKDEIVARCYKTQNGFRFEIGSASEKREPVSDLRNFFVTRFIRCATSAEVVAEEKRLRQQYRNAEIYVTEEGYR